MATTTAYEVETLTVQYTAALEMLLQQMDTRLRGTVRSAAHVGKRASPVQYIANLEFKQVGARGGRLDPQIAAYQRRWVSPQDRDLPIQVDSFDELRTIIDPKSAIVSSINSAANRYIDDVIIAAFFGTAQIGVDDSSLSTETFNSGADFPISVAIADTFGTGTASGLNFAKLIEAKRILARYENDVDGMDLHIALGAQQWADLMRQVEVVSTEFSRSAVYDNGGRMSEVFGFKITRSERLLTTGSDRRVPVWMTDGMHLGVWKDMQTIISQRNDTPGHPWQAYSMISLGATRLQGGKVLEIDCLDSTTPTGDITV